MITRTALLFLRRGTRPTSVCESLVDGVCVRLGDGVADGDGLEVDDSVRGSVKVLVAVAEAVGEGDGVADGVGPGARF